MDQLLWYLEITRDYAVQMLPCMGVGAAAFLALPPRRRKALARRGLRSGPAREAALFLFVIFCAGLAALTVFPSNFWTAAHWQAAFRGETPFFPLTPLSQSAQYIGWRPYFYQPFLHPGSWTFYMALANTLIFTPLGFLPNLLWRPRWWKGLAVGFCASFAIEFLQLFAGRSTDVDDLILNTLGVLAGYGLYRLLRLAVPGFTARFQVAEAAI